jgi:hypothetical protein
MFSIDKDKKKIEKREEKVRMTVPDIADNTIYENASKFRMHMKSLDEYDDALAGSIKSQNRDDIYKYAMLLKNTSPLLFTGKRKVELPKDFIILDTFFHFQSLAVVEAVESREMVSLNLEYDNYNKHVTVAMKNTKRKSSELLMQNKLWVWLLDSNRL